MSISWVEKQWNTQAIVKDEWVDESKKNVRRLIFVDGSFMYLKKLDSEESVLKLLNIYEVLLHHGVRVPQVVRTRSGHGWAVENGELFILYHELIGTVRNELGVEHGSLYGQGLARLHEALRHINLEKQSYMDLVQQLNEWAIPLSVEAAEQMGMNDEVCQLIELMKETWLLIVDQLPKQWIHRDPHPGNMLLCEDNTIGFLDFDISVTGVRLFDLCYLCTSQWMTVCSKPQEQLKWVELIRELRKGYEQVSTLGNIERTSAFFVMCAIQMIFVSFWRGQNKTELMKENLIALIELSKIRHLIDDAFSLD